VRSTRRQQRDQQRGPHHLGRRHIRLTLPAQLSREPDGFKQAQLWRSPPLNPRVGPTLTG
jgi:hypothetical protein